MLIPSNLTAMDDKVMTIRVLNSPGQNPEFLKITKWKVISKRNYLLSIRVH
jgi:hypothetical protein